MAKKVLVLMGGFSAEREVSLNYRKMCLRGIEKSWLRSGFP